MTDQQLGLICKTMARNRLMGVKLVGASIFEKQLNQWINEPAVKCELLADHQILNKNNQISHEIIQTALLPC